MDSADHVAIYAINSLVIRGYLPAQYACQVRKEPNCEPPPGEGPAGRCAERVGRFGRSVGLPRPRTGRRGQDPSSAWFLDGLDREMAHSLQR